MNESLTTTCTRCGKHLSLSSCPYCTVAGLDFESLLAAERLTSAEVGDVAANISGLLDIISGETHTLTTPLCRFGRDSSNDICIAADKSLSRSHFEIRLTDGSFYVDDCKSRNGTFVNNTLVRNPRKLSNGDLISAGMGRYRFFGAVPTKSDSSGSSDQEKVETENNPPIGRELPSGDETQKLEIKHLLNNIQPPEEKAQDSLLARLSSSLATPAAEEQTFQGLPVFIPEIDRLKKERNRLESILESTRTELKQVSGQINLAETIATRLFKSQGYELAGTAKRVFEILDWQVNSISTAPEELFLSYAGNTEAVVRMISCQGDPPPAEIEDLLNKTASPESQQKYLLLLQLTGSSLPERKLPLSKQFLQLAKQRNIGLFTTAQLLAIYRVVCFSGGEKAALRALILETSGLLPSFLSCQETVA